MKSSTDQNCTKTEAPNIEASSAVFVELVNVSIKTSQELGMLSRSLSDCKSLLLNVMIQSKSLFLVIEVIVVSVY